MRWRAWVMMLLLALPAASAHEAEPVDVGAPLPFDVFLEFLLLGRPDVGTGGALSVVGSFPSRVAHDHALGSTNAYDEATTMRGIALSRATGVAFESGDLADRTTSLLRVDSQDTLPEAPAVLAALTLGTFDSPTILLALHAVTEYLLFGVQSAPLPLDLLVLSAVSLIERMDGFHAVSLDEQTTNAGLVLAGASIAYDPHDLVVRRTRSQSDVDLERTVVFSTALAAAISAFGIQLADPVLVEKVANRVASQLSTRAIQRTPSLTAEVAFAAATLQRNGIAVAFDDVISFEETDRSGTLHASEVEIPRGNVLSSLLLGGGRNRGP